MDATAVGTALGFSVLVIAALFAVGHYRREHLRKRMLGEMQRRRFHDLSGPRH